MRPRAPAGTAASGAASRKCAVCGNVNPVASQGPPAYGPRVRWVGSHIVVLSLLGLAVICVIFLVALLQHAAGGTLLLSWTVVELVVATAVVLTGGAGILLWNSLREDRVAPRCSRCGALLPSPEGDTQR